MRQYPLLTIVMVLIASIVVGFLDMTMGYASLPHIIILAGAAILSAFNVKQAKFIALALGISIPVAHGVAGTIGITPPYEINSIVDFLRPIVLAIGGAFIGVRVSISMPKPQRDDELEEAKL
jgi:hypothetical protein